MRRELADFAVPDLYPYLVGLELVGPTLLAHGTPEQCARWLPSIATGDEIWCQLFSEPGAGSDLAGLAARATRDGDEWVVHGQKVWTSRGAYSRWGLLLARHDPSVPKHRGITAFGLDLHTPGVDVRPLRQMNGDAHFTEVFLDDARVPDADRIGAVGEGWRVALTCLSFERGASTAGGSGGLLDVDRLIALARSRGVALDPVVRDELARLVIETRVMALHRRARPRHRAGGPPRPRRFGHEAARQQALPRLHRARDAPSSVPTPPSTRTASCKRCSSPRRRSRSAAAPTRSNATSSANACSGSPRSHASTGSSRSISSRGEAR